MRKIFVPDYAFLVLLLVIFLEACSSTPKFPVKSVFLGETISTTVDSGVARYYLESYLYMGLPLSGQLSKYSTDKYPLLASKGPNDSLTLLRDIIAPDSLTIIALGSDHFFAEDPKINDKTIALTILVISYLEGKKGGNLHAIDPDSLWQVIRFEPKRCKTWMTRKLQ